MKNTKNLPNATISIALLLLVALACNVSTANIGSFKTSNDKDGKNETTNFRIGETIYGKAQISNNPGTVKVKLFMTDKKGEVIDGSEVSVNIENDGVANYSIPIGEDVPPGNYSVTGEMYNDENEKKDSKTVEIRITK